jgi:hypothetical protein
MMDVDAPVSLPSCFLTGLTMDYDVYIMIIMISTDNGVYKPPETKVWFIKTWESKQLNNRYQKDTGTKTINSPQEAPP